MSDPIKVVVADDHPFYRKGLVRSLRANGIDVVAEAPNGEEAVRAVERTAPDVVVMDLKMPGMSGVEATRMLAQRRRDVRVLALSVSAEDEDVTDAVLAGARGYVLKERPVEDVVAAIHETAAGVPHLSPEVAMLLLRRLCGPAGVQVDVTGVPLPAAERAVLDLLGRGRADHEIADALATSVEAVREHAASIVARLQAEDRLGAALRAHRRRRG